MCASWSVVCVDARCRKLDRRPSNSVDNAFRGRRSTGDRAVYRTEHSALCVGIVTREAQRIARVHLR